MSSRSILFLLPDLGGGGAQKVILQIAAGLDRSQFAPRLLVVGGSQTFAGEIDPYLNVELGCAERLRDGLPWLLRRIRALEPAICVSVMGYLNLALLALKPMLPKRTRLIVREANTLAATLSALPRGLPGGGLYRALYPRADLIVCPTQEISDELAAFAPRIEHRATVIPNPVDVERLRSKAASPIRREGAGMRFVSAGRLTRQKGYDQLIDALDHFPNGSHVTVFGEGPDREGLEAQARAAGVDHMITFAGFSQDLPAWIAGADALLLPSRWEGLPNVVLESLAVGTPAIISDQVAVKELAQAAPPGSILIREVGAPFAAAACEVRPWAGGELRSPLLPECYRVSSVIESWAGHLCRLGACASG